MSLELKQEKFVLKSNLRHNNKYDYSLFVYSNFATKGIIICPEHGEFEQCPNSHLAGSGCNKCSNKRKGPPLFGIDIFITKSNNTHGGKYDYSKFVYRGMGVKGIIICPIHGEFLQTPSHHIYSKQGCRACAGTVWVGKEKFVERANRRHDGKYDYSEFVYVHNKKNGIIICQEHGEFQQCPQSHLRGAGCPHCAGCAKLTTEECVRRSIDVHGPKYDYSKVICNGTGNKVIIICPIHGEFQQTPRDHIYAKHGCPKCCKSRKSNKEEFVQKANLVHGKYDYSEFEYTGSNKKGIIICPIHGEFLQRADDHLHGCGCRKCKFKNEQIVADFLTSQNILYTREYRIPRNDKQNYFSDFYIPNLNLIVEYNGRQHYGPARFATGNKRVSKEQAGLNFVDQQIRDEFIRNYCANNNICLIEIDGRKYENNTLKEFLADIFNWLEESGKIQA